MPGFEDHSHQLGSNPLKNEGPTKKSNRICTSRQTVCSEIRNGGAGGFMKPPGAPPHKNPESCYFTSTVAPASVNFFLMVSASSLLTPSLMGLGAPSTRSLASFRPRLVTSRTALITLILFAPTAVKTTENSVFSSTAGAAAAPPPPPAAIIGAAAAAETPSFSSSILTSWEASSRVKP